MLAPQKYDLSIGKDSFVRSNHGNTNKTKEQQLADF